MSITTGLPGSIIQAFSWMLIHSIWQGLVLALFAGMVLMLTQKVSAALRYNLVLMLFSVFLLVVSCTFVYEYNNARREAAQDQLRSSLQSIETFNKLEIHSRSSIFVNTPHRAEQSPFYSAGNIKTIINAAANYFSDHSLFIFIVWFVFFMVKSASMAGNMLYMHRAKQYRVNEPADYWKERVELLCEQLQLKKAVSLLESAYIKVPVVIGYFKPVILIPVGLIAGIPAAQVEAVILHELAHIRRNDYMVNFIQNAIEAVFFFNPGLLWISSRLREERENCCDDMAISQTNNKEEFVQALISFKEYSVAMPAYATAFSGQKNSLLNRIMRIAYQENKTLSVKESGIFIIGVAMLLLMAFTVYPAKNLKAVKSVIAAAKLPAGPLSEVNVAGTHAKNTTIPHVTASDAQITGIETTAIDTTKISAISGIDKTGPNFIAVIDDKEYPKDILYKISNSCISGMAVFRPEYGLKKYGPKASDGYVQIRTRHGEITYMTAIERENLIKEYSIPKSKFYNRIALKKEDGSFDKDKIIMNVGLDGEVAGDLPHDGKAAFYIDKTFYTEETIQKVSPAVIASFTGEYGVEGSDPKVPHEKGYKLIFKFNMLHQQPAPDTTIKYGRVIGEGLGPNPLVLINGKQYSADILTKINPSCFYGSATYSSQTAVKKFGTRAKDGCVELRVKRTIVYLTQNELENRAKEASIPKNNFLTRLALKDKNGNLYDEIHINDPSGNATLKLDVSHNGKVGFYIDKDFYEEEDIKKLSPEIIASLSGAGGCRPPDLRIDKAGYESIFDYTTTKYYLAMKKDSAEFNVTDVKAGKNAAVSALLELMPGIKINANGTIFYKDVIVTKLFLNNMPYAGEGIQQGIQSLPADIVEKIQVKPSAEDNGRAKMINLITKNNISTASKKGRYATWADY